MMKSSPLPCYLDSLWPKYLPMDHIREYPQPMFYTQCERPYSTPHVSEMYLDVLLNRARANAGTTHNTRIGSWIRNASLAECLLTGSAAHNTVAQCPFFFFFTAQADSTDDRCSSRLCQGHGCRVYAHTTQFDKAVECRTAARLLTVR